MVYELADNQHEQTTRPTTLEYSVIETKETNSLSQTRMLKTRAMISLIKVELTMLQARTNSRTHCVASENKQ